MASLLPLVNVKERRPAVSVIIPTYNRAHWLGDAIGSVLNQPFEDFEIDISDYLSCLMAEVS